MRARRGWTVRWPSSQAPTAASASTQPWTSCGEVRHSQRLGFCCFPQTLQACGRAVRHLKVCVCGQLASQFASFQAFNVAMRQDSRYKSNFLHKSYTHSVFQNQNIFAYLKTFLGNYFLQRFQNIQTENCHPWCKLPFFTANHHPLVTVLKHIFYQ